MTVTKPACQASDLSPKESDYTAKIRAPPAKGADKPSLKAPGFTHILQLDHAFPIGKNSIKTDKNDRSNLVIKLSCTSASYRLQLAVRAHFRFQTLIWRHIGVLLRWPLRLDKTQEGRFLTVSGKVIFQEDHPPYGFW